MNVSELQQPTYEEINEIIEQLMPNKAAGPDGRIAEFIEYGGLTLKQKIYQLIMKIRK